MSSLRTFLDNLTLEQLAARLELAMDGASLGIWDWDLRDNSVQFDRRWCEMLGLDHADVAMELSSWESRVHPDDIAGCYADIQAYLGGATEQYENIHRMRHADGRWVYILDRGRVSGWDEDGKAIRFTGTHFDCTATEKARRVLENQERLLGSLLRGIPTAACLVDASGRVLAASDEWTAWFASHGDGDSGVSPVGAQALPEWAEALQRAREGLTTTAVETRVSAGRAGAGRVLRWSMRPWGMVDGRSRGAIVRFDDVTTELEERAEAAHLARLSSLGRMAGGIAHELNTPLQTLVLDASVVNEELATDTPDLPLLKELGQEILTTAEYLAEVVSGMRALSRGAAGDPLQAVGVAQVLHQLQRLTETRLRQHDVDFILVDADPAWTVQARPSQLLQILTNLVSNATDAVAEHPESWVRIAATQTADALEIRVVDSGVGIPEALQESIMAPFFTTKAPGQGTGLGLSLSRSLAEGMGAVLRLDPDAPHTTFVLTFPHPEVQ